MLDFNTVKLSKDIRRTTTGEMIVWDPLRRYWYILHNDPGYSGEETELKGVYGYDYSWAVSEDADLEEWRDLKLITEEGVHEL